MLASARQRRYGHRRALIFNMIFRLTGEALYRQYRYTISLRGMIAWYREKYERDI